MTIAATDSLTVFIGSNAQGDGQGIYAAELDLNAGELSKPTVAASIPFPSFLALSHDGRLLVAIGRGPNETELRDGRIVSFAVDPATHELSVLNELPTQGTGPCYVALDRAGRHALAANYGGGSVEAFAIDADGRLVKQTAFVQHEGSSVNPERQEGPHAHSINFDHDEQFAIAADLGTDELVVYKFDANDGSLAKIPRREGGTNDKSQTARVAPGAGPRHMVWNDSGSLLYVVNEMGNTVSVFDYDAKTGELTEVQSVSTLPAEFKDHSQASEIAIHPNGEYLYAANRGHNSVAHFAIDKESGRIEFVEARPCGGDWPRHIGVDPTGQFLLVANQNSNNLVAIRIDADSGKLTETTADHALTAPMCVRFLLRD